MKIVVLTMRWERRKQLEVEPYQMIRQKNMQKWAIVDY